MPILTCMSTTVDLNKLAIGEYVRFQIDDTPNNVAVMVKLNSKAHGGSETEADHMFLVTAPRFTALPVTVPRELVTGTTISIADQNIHIASPVYINS